jgi:hypothetical protein
MGISGHDGCHYTTVGYSQIGDMVYKQVARDFYGSDDTLNIDPPNITKAFYRDIQRKELVLEFSPRHSSLLAQDDTLVGGAIGSLIDYIYLDNDTSRTRTISLEGNKIILHLRTSSTASTVTYLPEINYHGTGVIYEGPWIVNSRGIGALSFWRFPITDSLTVSVPSTHDNELHISAYPNPFSGRTTIEYTVPNTSRVTIEVMDVLGRHVQTVVDEVMVKGSYQKTLESVATLYPSGVYYCRMIVGDTIEMIRLVVE